MFKKKITITCAIVTALILLNNVHAKSYISHSHASGVSTHSKPYHNEPTKSGYNSESSGYGLFANEHYGDSRSLYSSYPLSESGKDYTRDWKTTGLKGESKNKRSLHSSSSLSGSGKSRKPRSSKPNRYPSVQKPVYHPKPVSYPSSRGGLSGSGGSKPSTATHKPVHYPNSNSGWSGSGGSKPSSATHKPVHYPNSNSGWSGSGGPKPSTATHKPVHYPNSNSGFSGSGGSKVNTTIHKPVSYPHSNSGLSGSGGSKINTTIHKPVVYPNSNSGLSGSGVSKINTTIHKPVIYPNSNSRLSGSGGSKINTTIHKPVVYPNSNSGLSGSGVSKINTTIHKPVVYPNSNSGLSGSGVSKINTTIHKPVVYPNSNSGLSGSGGSKVNTTIHKPVIYPNSNSGLSGSGVSKTNTTIHKPVVYPNSNSGLSGSGVSKINTTIHKPVVYPNSNGGLSGNQPGIIHHPSPPHYTAPTVHTPIRYWEVNQDPHKIRHHHHYHYDYRPPTVIHYTPSYGTVTSYPVYTGHHLPPYVYEYRRSESKYRRLLAGLALYNLGSVSNSHSKQRYHESYTPKPDEVCIFGVRYETGNNDEMAINCRTITNFIWEEESKPQTVNVNQIPNSIVNQALLPNGMVAPGVHQAINQPNTASSLAPNEVMVMLPNGTLVTAAVADLIKSKEAIPRTQVLLPNGTVVDNMYDTKFYGSAVSVKPSMECYVKRVTRYTDMKKTVPCNLLQTYATQSLRKNTGVVNKSTFVLILVSIVGRILI